jgi:hypothetical protein
MRRAALIIAERLTVSRLPFWATISPTSRIAATLFELISGEIARW